MGNDVSTQSSALNQPIPNSVSLHWHEIKSAFSIPPAEGSASATHNGTMYFFGGGSIGQNGPVQNDQLLAFTTTIGEWSVMTPTNENPCARTGAAAVTVKGNVLIFGGLNQDKEFNDSVPSPRDKLSCCSIDHKVYFFGGFGPQPQEESNENEDDEEEEEEDDDMGPSVTFGWFNDVHVFDAEHFTWKVLETTGTPPTPRAAFGMAAVKDKIFIIGGRDSQQRTNEIYMLDLATTPASWVQINAGGVLPQPRSFHTCTAIGNRIVLFGGINRENIHLNDVHVFDAETRVWFQPTIQGHIPPRGFHSAVLHEKNLYVLGGSADWDPILHDNRTWRNDFFSMDLTPVLEAPPVTLPTTTNTNTTTPATTQAPQPSV